MKKKNAFRSNRSLVGQVFELCMTGITVEELKKFVSDRGGSPLHMLRKIRKGVNVTGERWLVDEADGKIKVVYPIP